MRKRAFNRILLMGAAVMLCPIVGVAGCSKEEEKTPAGYYTGPMKSKGSAGSDTAPAPTAPANNAAPKR